MNSILNFIHTAGYVLLHSIRTAAFCWAAAALVVAVPVIRGMTRRTRQLKSCTAHQLSAPRSLAKKCLGCASKRTVLPVSMSVVMSGNVPQRSSSN